MDDLPLYDLESPAFRQDPYPTYAEMRQLAPAYRNPRSNNRTWYFTRYEDVEFILKDRRIVKDYRHAFSPEKAKELEAKIPINIVQTLLNVDPPDHTRLRALVSKAFTPQRIAGLHDHIQAIADDLLDTFQHQGQTDLIPSYAFPLPIRVICDLLGVPSADRDLFRKWSHTLVELQTAHALANQKEAAVTMQTFLNYIQAMCAERQAHPQDDLMTALVQTEITGDKLNQKELGSMIMLLMLAGHETTVNLISNGTWLLLTHPEQLAQVQADPALWPSAIEEMLRFASPLATSTRAWVAEDLVLGGQQLRRGDVIMAVIGSANRDTSAFESPEVFDITRPNNRHLAFGHSIHYCLGAPLARLEGLIAFPTLLRRLPGLRLAVPAEELVWGTSLLMRGLQALPVAWEPS